MTEAAPAWAKGVDMAFLKECAALYREEFKPHTYGAFGLPKERDVADAQTDKGLVWTRDQGLALAAVAIFRQADRPSGHSDFANRVATIKPRDIYVRSIAGSDKGKRRLLGGLRARSTCPAMWVEAHVENQSVVDTLKALDFVLVMTKISASSDLKGMFLREWSEDATRWPAPLEPADRPSAACLAPDFLSPAEQAALLEEADAYSRLVGGAYAQHYSGYNKRSTWTSFALKGFDASDPGFIIKPSEMSMAWKKENPARLEAKAGPTKAYEHFPTAQAILARLDCEQERVRFMRLSAKGGELTRHSDITDPDCGTADGKLMRLHIPLRSGAKCVFRTWDLLGQEQRTHLAERALCYLDTRKPHAVVNPDEIERVHLVIDAWATSKLRGMVAAQAA